MKMVNGNREFTIETVRKHWDHVAAVYDGWNKAYDTTHFQRFFETIKHVQLAPGMQVLDVWSRTGNASHFLYQTCPEINYIGLELSFEMIVFARKKYPERNFVQASLVKYPFPNSFFERVVSLETLEHVPNPIELLVEIRRVIKPGGRLVLSTPPASAEWMTSLVDTIGMNHGEGPHRFLPSREVKLLLEQSRFRLLLHKGTVLIPAGPRLLREKGNEWLENHVQNTFLAEFGIRQFFVAEAVN